MVYNYGLKVLGAIKIRYKDAGVYHDLTESNFSGFQSEADKIRVAKMGSVIKTIDDPFEVYSDDGEDLNPSKLPIIEFIDANPKIQSLERSLNNALENLKFLKNNGSVVLNQISKDRFAEKLKISLNRLLQIYRDSAKFSEPVIQKMEGVVADIVDEKLEQFEKLADGKTILPETIDNIKTPSDLEWSKLIGQKLLLDAG